ncbi:hypothetical protein DEU56DRAFT_756343 [Suillus clintonianus]|uniref:uncharacterized protein n=1 Tax=Suillus clintonianus TaxID=1904413 RepID=UPI001B879229|nr:uncharacterized protein DEU56DRAFT_756343 [Suillus clintonianus]KAG2136437.1 hypothetical protein DEU56DRAFT_756343 [Suillus clintonianus]
MPIGGRLISMHACGTQCEPSIQAVHAALNGSRPSKQYIRHAAPNESPFTTKVTSHDQIMTSTSCMNWMQWLQWLQMVHHPVFITFNQPTNHDTVIHAHILLAQEASKKVDWSFEEDTSNLEGGITIRYPEYFLSLGVVEMDRVEELEGLIGAGVCLRVTGHDWLFRLWYLQQQECQEGLGLDLSEIWNWQAVMPEDPSSSASIFIFTCLFALMGW